MAAQGSCTCISFACSSPQRADQQAFISVDSCLAKLRLFCGFEKFYARRLLCGLCIQWELHTKELQVKIMPIVWCHRRIQGFVSVSLRSFVIKAIFDFWLKPNKAPCKGKSIDNRRFCPYRALCFGCITPRTLPWARSFCPFGAYHLSVFDTPTTFTSPLWYYRQQPFRRP